MINTANFVNESLNTLKDKVLSFSNSIVQCNNLGIIPNKKDDIILDWSFILISAYENYRIFTDEQKDRINLLYRKVLEL